MNQIDKCVEAIKLAYLSGQPIVWVVTDHKEVANDVAIGFANAHFGGYMTEVVRDYVFSDIMALDPDNLGKLKQPPVYFNWLAIENTGKPSEKMATLQIDFMAKLECFINLYYGLKIDEGSRTASDSCKEGEDYWFSRAMAIVASPYAPPKSWIGRYIETIYVDALEDAEIKEIIDNFIASNSLARLVDDASDEKNKKSFIDQLVVGFRGLSRRDITQVLERCLVAELFEHFDSDPGAKKKVLNEVRQLKRRMLEGFNGLKWIDDIDDSQTATGLDAITKWLGEQKDIYSDPEKKHREGYDIPKGLLVTGIPGTGKSLMAREAARILELPLIAMDLGDIQEGIVGASEEHMAAALRMIDAMAPCVLWIDEIEKAFSGANSGQSDGGVMRRMFGKFLTWMQEKKSFCFVFATSNDITQLPPELFRSERFDEKFYNFMPSASECADIFVANIKRHNERYIKANNEPFSLFGKDFEDKGFWLDFLNTLCMTAGNGGKVEEVKIDSNGLWQSGYVPQKKLFTGADIASFVKRLKFRLLRDRSNRISTHTGAFTRAEVANVLPAVIKDFMPYGETNLNDIARCFFALAKNRFRSASGASDEVAILRFSDYSEDSGMKYHSDRFRLPSQAYDQALYRSVVGAINNLFQKEHKYNQDRLNNEAKQ